MDHPKRKRHPLGLWIMIGLALALNLLVYFRPELTGNDPANGLVGVFLGLFIAAFPVTNFLDMLLSELGSVRWRAIRPADLPWVALNLLTLFCSLIVVVLGTKLFFKHWQPG